MQLNDNVRAAFIAFVQSLLPLLVLLGLVELTDTQISGIMLAVTNGMTLAALLFKQGQSSQPTP